jgi:hypothetical protein
MASILKKPHPCYDPCCDQNSSRVNGAGLPAYNKERSINDHAMERRSMSIMLNANTDAFLGVGVFLTD